MAVVANRIDFNKTMLNRLLSECSETPRFKDFTDVSGMTVRQYSTAAGSTITFIFRKRRKGKIHKRSLGSFPSVGLSDARANFMRRAALLAANGSIDTPEEIEADAREAEKKAAAKAISFGECVEKYLAKKSQQVSQYTFYCIENRFQYSLKQFYSLPFNLVTPSLIYEKVLEPYAKAGKNAACTSLCRDLKALGEFYCALQNDPINPYLRLRTLVPKYEVEHHPTFNDDELEEKMRDLFERFKKFPLEVQAQLHFHFLVPLRSDEVRSLLLEQCKGATEVTVKTKTWDRFTMPLNTQAQRIVQWMAGRKHSSPYLFESPRGGKSDGKYLNRLIHAVGVNFVIHSVRSCCMQFLVKQPNVKDTIASLCLAHVIGNQTEQAYNRGEYLEERREAMQLWGDFVEKCIGDNVFY